jgi:hypothetical protein
MTMFRHGQVTREYDDGGVYIGTLLDGKPHGHGTYKGVDGEVYVGDWKEDKPH